MKERVTQKGRPVGLYLDKPNHKVWVKTWAELIRDAETRLDFVQEKLRIEVSAKEIEERLAQLKSSFLKQETDNHAQPAPSFRNVSEQSAAPA